MPARTAPPVRRVVPPASRRVRADAERQHRCRTTAVLSLLARAGSLRVRGATESLSYDVGVVVLSRGSARARSPHAGPIGTTAGPVVRPRHRVGRWAGPAARPPAGRCVCKRRQVRCRTTAALSFWVGTASATPTRRPPTRRPPPTAGRCVCKRRQVPCRMTAALSFWVGTATASGPPASASPARLRRPRPAPPGPTRTQTPPRPGRSRGRRADGRSVSCCRAGAPPGSPRTAPRPRSTGCTPAATSRRCRRR